MNNALTIALFSPILITIGGIISWFLKSKRDELINQEEKSKQFKTETYKKVLEPFIAILTFTIPEVKKQKEINKMLSLDYRKAVFDLTTFGSDRALKIYNDLMQTFFHSEEFKEENSENYNDEHLED